MALTQYDLIMHLLIARFAKTISKTFLKLQNQSQKSESTTQQLPCPLALLESYFHFFEG